MEKGNSPIWGENRLSPMEKDKFSQLVNKELLWWGNEEFPQLDYQKFSQISPDSEYFPRPAVAPVATFCRSEKSGCSPVHRRSSSLARSRCVRSRCSPPPAQWSWRPGHLLGLQEAPGGSWQVILGPAVKRWLAHSQTCFLVSIRVRTISSKL